MFRLRRSERPAASVDARERTAIGYRLRNAETLVVFIVFTAVGLFDLIVTVVSSDRGTLWETLLERQAYTRTLLVINYFDNGFVRRGLAGTITHVMPGGYVGQGVLFHIFSVAWACLPLCLIVRSARATAGVKTGLYLVFVMAISPQLLIGWGADECRTDLIVVGVICWSAILLAHDRHKSAGLLSAAALLTHEAGTIFGASLLVGSLALQARDPKTFVRTAVSPGLLLVAGILLVLLAQKLFGEPDAALATYMFAHSPVFSHDPPLILHDSAIYYAVSGARGMKTTLCWNNSANHQYYMVFLAGVIIIAVYVAIFGLSRRYVAALLVATMPFIFMNMVASDTGRWLKFAVLNLWLLTYLAARADLIAIRAPHRALGVVCTLFFLAGGVTKDTPINNHLSYRLTALGYGTPPEPRAYLDKCDPQWIRVAHGQMR